MIRHSIHNGLGRGRPELSRLSEGISASLRQFSAAQARCADEGRNNGGARSSSRQRSAAAASEMLSMNDQKRNKTSSTTKPSVPRTSPQAKPLGVGSAGGAPTSTGFTGFRRVDAKDLVKPSPGAGAPGVVAAPGAVIRGGFRGRGGGAFAGRGGGAFAGRGGGASANRGGGFSASRGGAGGAGGAFGQSRGGARGGRGGRGRGRGRRDGDDRPQRRGREDFAAKREEQDFQRFKAQKMGQTTELTEYLEAVENGVDRSYQPVAPKDLLASLAGYAPAIASNPSTLAKEATIITQAVALGGGRPYHPEDWPSPVEARKQYRQGHGIFFPNERAKAWVENFSKPKFQSPPKETQTAVLDAAILGRYEGPRHAELKDTIGTVRSFVKRDGTWNMPAERSMEAKIKTLLPGAAQSGAAKGRGQAKRA
ncbi:TATA-binding protein-associated factor 2N [Neopestalotiopsis sp. 37M]|nr:TATA-binding protein-associated factor 2N [Neopestalotiopsis sp. 37M]